MRVLHSDNEIHQFLQNNEWIWWLSFIKAITIYLSNYIGILNPALLCQSGPWNITKLGPFGWLWHGWPWCVTGLVQTEPNLMGNFNSPINALGCTACNFVLVLLSILKMFLALLLNRNMMNISCILIILLLSTSGKYIQRLATTVINRGYEHGTLNVRRNLIHIPKP